VLCGFLTTWLDDQVKTPLYQDVPKSFHEFVLMNQEISRFCPVASTADIFLVAGTSMLVYPAAGLIDYVRPEIPKYVIDPKVPEVRHSPNLHFIPEKASVGMEIVRRKIVAA
jgi:NAD-dependent SIR2 family protein deacetylase